MKQEQSSNTPDYWAKFMIGVVEGILRRILPDGLPDDRKEAIEANIRKWVVDIREDEINAIIREIEKTQEEPFPSPTTQKTIALLRDRLPK